MKFRLPKPATPAENGDLELDAEAIDFLRRDSIRDVPRAACFFIGALWFTWKGYDDGLFTSVADKVVFVADGLIHAVVALGLAYGGIRSLWPNHRDKLLRLLVDDYCHRKADLARKAHAEKRAEQAASLNGP